MQPRPSFVFHFLKASVILLLLTTLHQVLLVQSTPVDCNYKAIQKPLDDCKVAEERAINSTADPNDTEAYCRIKFNRLLCTIDASCTWCTATTALNQENRLKSSWTDLHPNCTPWYDSYEYANKRRCIPATVIAWGVVVIVVPSLAWLIGCLGGLYCYFTRQGTITKGLILAGPGERKLQPGSAKSMAKSSSAKSFGKSLQSSRRGVS